MIKIHYRPEIDSLRAIAVIGVIIYHSKINLFGSFFLPGGLHGVDIFFVISGYLITSIILKEKDQTGTFSFKNFYINRIKRILPALLFVVFISTSFAYFFLLPTNLVDFSKSAVYSIFFSSNFYFYFSGQIYGMEDGLLKPLLHTWSLSVEEQFYIIFPLLVIFIVKNKKNLIGFLTLLSFLFSLYLSSTNSSLEFYVLPTRAWEILAGSYLAYHERVPVKHNDNKILASNILSVIGLLLIIYSFFNVGHSLFNISISRILSVLGTILLIQNCKNKNFFSNILSHKILVGIGLISYSLYLWHYPIFSFARIGYFARSNFDYCVVALIIVLISIFTYYFIEKPFRSQNTLLHKQIKIILFIILLLNIAAISNYGFPKRFPSAGSFNLDNLKFSEEVRIEKYNTGVPLFRHNNKINILVIGNSHGRDLFNALKFNENLFREYEFSILDTQIHCLATILISNSLCDKKMDNKNIKIFKESEVLLLSSSFTDEDIKTITKVITELKKSNKKIILTTVTPSFNKVNNSLLIDKFFIENARLPSEYEKKSLELENYLLLNKDITAKNKKLFRIANELNLKILEKKNLICNDITKKCLILTPDNKKITYDGHHYTLDGAKFIGTVIFKNNWLNIN